RAARVPRAHGRVLSEAWDRHRVRQSLLRDHLRGTRGAQHLRDRGGARHRRRVPLAVQNVLHDRLAARVGRGAPGAHRGAGARGQGYVARFREQRDEMRPAISAQGFEPETPEATMYVWVPLPEGVASAAFARRALTEVGVVTLAGSGFGAGGEGFFRIALTVDTPRLVEAAERLGKVLAAV